MMEALLEGLANWILVSIEGGGELFIDNVQLDNDANIDVKGILTQKGEDREVSFSINLSQNHVSSHGCLYWNNYYRNLDLKRFIEANLVEHLI